MLHLEPAVDGDRVVNGAEQGELPLDPEQSVAEALVVVDDVERARSTAEVIPGPKAERERLGKSPERERRHLDEVGPVLELPEAGHPRREVVVPDVEAGQLDQRHTVVELGIGLARDDLDVMAEVDERLGQMADVHPLTADVGLAAVRQEGDAQRPVAVHSPSPSPHWRDSVLGC